MSNRICIGRRNASDIGIYVSRPGDNVMTAPLRSMLLATDEPLIQIVAQGTIASPVTSAPWNSITLPNLGFRPYLIMMSDRYRTNWQFLSDTSVEARCSDRPFTSNFPAAAVKWFALNFPIS